MGKVITVWGSPGSGKSMFSCILAKALTRDKRKAIIINAEISVPMLPVWLPEQIIQTNASVGQVLSSVEIDTSLVAGHVSHVFRYHAAHLEQRAVGSLVGYHSRRPEQHKAEHHRRGHSGHDPHHQFFGTGPAKGGVHQPVNFNICLLYTSRANERFFFQRLSCISLTG